MFSRVTFTLLVLVVNIPPFLIALHTMAPTSMLSYTRWPTPCIWLMLFSVWAGLGALFLDGMGLLSLWRNFVELLRCWWVGGTYTAKCKAGAGNPDFEFEDLYAEWRASAHAAPRARRRAWYWRA